MASTIHSSSPVCSAAVCSKVLLLLTHCLLLLILLMGDLGVLIGGFTWHTHRRMAENGFAPPPPPREFCRHILSCRELKAESFKRCLHSVLRGVSL